MEQIKGRQSVEGKLLRDDIKGKGIFAELASQDSC